MSNACLFTRTWAMPNRDTFTVPPIGKFVRRYLDTAKVSIDPFARNKRLATYTNDLDPPYSPRQISECYKSVGLEVGMKETQSSLLYQRVRNALISILTEDAIVLSFGWNTVGMGKKHGFEQVEILLCCHGGAHNDTICLAERRRPNAS